MVLRGRGWFPMALGALGITGRFARQENSGVGSRVVCGVPSTLGALGVDRDARVPPRSVCANTLGAPAPPGLAHRAPLLPDYS